MDRFDEGPQFVVVLASGFCLDAAADIDAPRFQLLHCVRHVRRSQPA
jgi:hypothetical protein